MMTKFKNWLRNKVINWLRYDLELIKMKAAQTELGLKLEDLDNQRKSIIPVSHQIVMVEKSQEWHDLVKTIDLIRSIQNSQINTLNNINTSLNNFTTSIASLRRQDMIITNFLTNGRTTSVESLIDVAGDFTPRPDNPNTTRLMPSLEDRNLTPEL